jgi:pimeloyl-ACP methyl ester carboxylesterase
MNELSRQKKRVATSFGEIAYFEVGDASLPPVLFVHGIPTSSFLWRHVLKMLQGQVHGYAPDLMGLGDTRVGARARFDMDAQAEMLAELMTALGHERFTVVCHDQGGAAAQLLAARMPERLEALVLTNCVCYDNWPVPAIARLQALCRARPLMDLAARAGIFELVECRTPLSSFKRGVYKRDRLSDEAIREYLRPLRASAASRDAFLRFLMTGHPRYTELAVPGLRRFDKPTFVIWAADDHYISPSWGRKLFEEIPGAVGFELVPFCGHFWAEERPAEFAAHISRFIAEHVARPAVKRLQAKTAAKRRTTKPKPKAAAARSAKAKPKTAAKKRASVSASKPLVN